MVYPSEVFDPMATLQAVEREGCTSLYGVPTMFQAILSHPDASVYNVSSLRTGIMAGSVCPVEVVKGVMTKLHMPEVTIAYGMTETSPITFQTTLADPLEKRLTTIGRVHPHAEAKIVDDNGHMVARGTPGQVLTRGYAVMLGYWDDVDKTKEAIDSAGWMHTGDVGVMDEEGYCSIVGRIKDVIIRGGENIYPREIEEVLTRHPHISQVEIFGVPDEYYGEEVCAWVKRKSGVHEGHLDEEQVQAYCKELLANFKVPKHIKFVDHFPMTVSGKVQKFKMREHMSTELKGRHRSHHPHPHQSKRKHLHTPETTASAPSASASPSPLSVSNNGDT